MPLLPDDLSVLLSQLSITPTSSPSSSPRSESPPPQQQEYMTTQQRLNKLTEMRTLLQQQLLLLLTRVHHGNAESRNEVESQVEEYKDLLDGMDLLIQRLSRSGTEHKLDSFEWRGTYEL